MRSLFALVTALLISLGVGSAALLFVAVQTPAFDRYPLKPAPLPLGTAAAYGALPTLTFYQGLFQVTSQKLPTYATLAFDRASLLHLYDVEDDVPVFQQPAADTPPLPLQLSPRAYSHLKSVGSNESFQVAIESDCPRYDYTITFPETGIVDRSSGSLFALTTTTYQALPQQTFTFQLDGLPEAFPDDQYACGYSLTLFFPVWITWGSSSPTIQPKDFNVVLATSPRNHQLMSLSYQVDNNPPSHGYTEGLRLAVERPWIFKTFAYPLALAPLLLLLFLGHLVAILGGGDARASAIADLVGLAALALTILPLRAVLVPAEVVGYTHIDLVLAGEVLFVIGLACARYAIASHVVRSARGPK
jgi:hypothetical protein